MEELPLIYSYTRKQAIEDGVLFDITPMASEAGFKVHTVITAGLYHELTPTKEDAEELGQSFEGRLWDLLAILKFEIVKQSKNAPNRIDFEFIMVRARWTPRIPVEKQMLKVWAVVGPGDDREPVMTILLTGED